MFKTQMQNIQYNKILFYFWYSINEIFNNSSLFLKTNIIPHIGFYIGGRRLNTDIKMKLLNVGIIIQTFYEYYWRTRARKGKKKVLNVFVLFQL